MAGAWGSVGGSSIVRQESGSTRGHQLCSEMSLIFSHTPLSQSSYQVLRLPTYQAHATDGETEAQRAGASERRWGRAGLEPTACVAQSPEQCSLQSCAGWGGSLVLDKAPPHQVAQGLPGIRTVSVASATHRRCSWALLCTYECVYVTTASEAGMYYATSSAHSRVMGALDRAGTPPGTPVFAETPRMP